MIRNGSARNNAPMGSAPGETIALDVADDAIDDGEGPVVQDAVLSALDDRALDAQVTQVDDCGPRRAPRRACVLADQRRRAGPATRAGTAPAARGRRSA